MPSGYRSGGVDFDNLFDPYVQGAKSIATGRRAAGVDLNQRYAHISFGTKRANVGYRVGGVDVSNLWAAKGTAIYGLSINGKSYTANPTTAGSVSSATLQFITNNTAFSVVDPNRTPSTVVSGTIPAGATQCRVTTTLASGTPADVFNQLSAFTPLTASNLRTEIGNFQDEDGQPEIQSTYNLKIEYRNSSGVVISTSSVGFTVNTAHT